jgi:hypothetical protein
LLVEAGQGGLHIERCSDGASRVVLVRDGDAKHGHDGIADIFLNGSSMLAYLLRNTLPLNARCLTRLRRKLSEKTSPKIWTSEIAAKLIFSVENQDKSCLRMNLRLKNLYG